MAEYKHPSRSPYIGKPYKVERTESTAQQGASLGSSPSRLHWPWSCRVLVRGGHPYHNTDQGLTHEEMR